MAAARTVESANDHDVDSGERISLYDVVSEKTMSNNDKALIHRIVCVGKLTEDLINRKELGDHYERLVKTLFTYKYHIEAITGLLLIYPQHFIHLLEGPIDLLKDIIHDIETRESRGSMTTNSKILLFMSKVPSRLYAQWHYRVLNIPAIRMDEANKEDSIENQVSDTLSMATKLGCEISKLPKLATKNGLDQLVDKYRHLLTPQDMLDRLVFSNKLMSPSDYLQRYNCPISVTLDRELTWPVETKLFRQ